MFKTLKNGISLNFEHRGKVEGYTLLFLHGNSENLNTFSFFFDKLQDYSLYFIDSRCHGKSSHSELSYDNMADDIELFIEEMNIERCSIIGFSDGAIISILLSLKLKTIDKIFLIGPNLSPEGLTTDCINFLKEDYEKTGSIYSKLCLEEPNIDKELLKESESRAIVIGGEYDLIRKGHLELIRDSYKNSTLYIIDKATHFIPTENPNELLSIIQNELSLDVYFEDNHVIVVDKPVGILSQEDETKDKDILSITKEYLKTKYNKPGNVYVGLIQRLDRNVSGLMVLSKTSKATERLNENRPKKHYYALVSGIVEKEEDTLIDYISKDEKNRTAYIDEKDGKIAILKYKKISNDENYSLLDVFIETGRFHQIRFQLSNIGHPLYNDIKYNTKIERNGYEIGLDAYKVDFIHPTTKCEISIERTPKRTIFKKYL
ncbi:alpha/beta fold hydrolase [bacterium]|nr:alpha/beta fold hydrolase [bacterium]